MRYLFLITFVGLCVPQISGALTPVEGILLGEPNPELQTDPLSRVFTDIFTTSDSVEYRKLKNYQALLETGKNFADQCSVLGPSTYTTSWREQQAKRSYVAAVQYVGLDSAIKAIGAYAKKLDVPEDQFATLTDNLVSSYCSQNVTVMSLRTIRTALKKYYDTPSETILPSVDASPYVTELYRSGSNSPETRSRELQYAIRNFRAFCSWGGNTEDYRLLPPYLKNPFIMGLVAMNMSGVRFAWDERSGRMEWKKDDPDAVRVVCQDLVCRQMSRENFNRYFPTSTGSTGVGTDLNKLYCQHFRYLDYDAKKTIPEVREWIKAIDLEEPYLETGFFVSLMTGVPDPFMIQSKFSDIPAIVKSSVDERWTKWSRESLSGLSRNLLYEESLRVRAEPRRSIADVREDLLLDFHVTLGEMDRIMKNNDKIGVSFNFLFSKSWLKSLITRWNTIAENVDVEGEKKLKADIAHYIGLQLRTKEKMFTQKVWNEDFSRLLADELLAQVLSYRGGFFESNKDEMIPVPVRFSYGIFALSYLRFKTQVAKGSASFNL